MRRPELGFLAASNVLAVLAVTSMGYGLRVACAAPSGLYAWISQYIPYVCYSDLSVMWSGRQLSLHLPPYLFGTFTPPDQLGNGAVEYPVFSGVAMWLTALPARSYGEFFLITTIVAAALASAVALLLVFLVGYWAYVWSFSPLLLLYASYNWDLYPVLASVLAFAVVLRGPASWSDRRKGVAAAVLLGVGCLFKLYPALFVIPLALWFSSRSRGSRSARARSAASLVLVCAGVVVAGNLPFAVLGTDGWLGSIRFQGYRPISANTMSIWYWWTLPFHDQNGIDGRSLAAATAATTAVVALGCLIAVLAGFRRRSGGGDYPWIGVAGAMTVAYMLFGKVDSPQYGLWLVPFFALLSVRLWLVVAYAVADLLLYAAWFHPPFLAALPWDSVVTPMLVTVNAVALAAAFVAFLRADPRPLIAAVPHHDGAEPVPSGGMSPTRPAAVPPDLPSSSRTHADGRGVGSTAV